MCSLTRDKTEPNLLVKLRRWARLKQQDENYTTEAFAHLLEYLLKHAPDSGLELFGNLTGFTNPSWLSSKGCGDIKVDTQYRTDDESTDSELVPDIKISGEGFCIFVEVKVEADVDVKQLIKYQEALDNEVLDQKSPRRLVLLTKYEPKEVPKGVEAVLWKEIAKGLRQLRKRCRSVYGKFLIDQFVEFIDHPKFFVEEERSQLSKELRAYMKGKGDKSIFERPFKVDQIREEQGLDNLYGLLLLMQKAAKKIYNWRSSPFSEGYTDGWVGINLNKNLYCFYLWLEKPEIIYFQRYHADTSSKSRKKVNVENWDGETGWIYRGTWHIEKDLTETKYFSESREGKRLEIIEKFFKDSLEYADKIWGPGR